MTKLSKASHITGKLVCFTRLKQKFFVCVAIASAQMNIISKNNLKHMVENTMQVMV